MLRYREINPDLFRALLKDHRLFTRPPAVVEAIKHVKCTEEFAWRYGKALAKTPAGVRQLQSMLPIMENKNIRRIIRKIHDQQSKPVRS